MALICYIETTLFSLILSVVTNYSRIYNKKVLSGEINFILKNEFIFSSEFPIFFANFAKNAGVLLLSDLY